MASSVPYTIFRPVFFMDNWQGFGREYILQGTLSLPLDPGCHFQQIAVEDIGAFVALALSQPDRWVERELDVAGDDRSIAEVAAAFGRVIGRAVQYIQAPWDQFRQIAGEEYTKMFRWFDDVGYDADVPAVRKELPQLLDFEQYLRKTGWEGAKP